MMEKSVNVAPKTELAPKYSDPKPTFGIFGPHVGAIGPASVVARVSSGKLRVGSQTLPPK